MSDDSSHVVLKDGQEVFISGSQISNEIRVVTGPDWTVYLARMSPDEARDIAEKLVIAADYVDPEGADDA